MWEALSTVIAAIALCYSIESGRRARKLKKRFDNEQVRIQQYEHDETRERDRFNKELARLNSSESVVPYFYMSLQDADIRISKDETKLEICLVNVGLATAVNIQLQSENPAKGLEGYIASQNSIKTRIYEYLNRTAAMVGDQIVFNIVIWNYRDDFTDEFRFKLEYSDVTGRMYVQKFMFVYGNFLTPLNYSQNNISGRPIMTKDIV